MTDAEAKAQIAAIVDAWAAERAPATYPTARITVAGQAVRSGPEWAQISGQIVNLLNGSPVATHPLKNTIAIDCVGDWKLAWPGGLDKLLSARVDAQRPVGLFFLDPIAKRTDGTLIWDEVTGRYLASQGRKVGVRYVPHSWDAGLDPILAAAKAKAYRDWYANRGVPVACFEHDIENVVWKGVQHSLEWQLAYLLGTPGHKGVAGANGSLPDPSKPDTQGLLYSVPGVWTMEGRQSTNTSSAGVAAVCGMLVGPQAYNGDMTEMWSLWREVVYWGQRCGLDHFIPYLDARSLLRAKGEFEAVLYDTTRLTELFT